MKKNISKPDDTQAGVSPYAERLAEWFDRFARDLPWRRTKDAYRIWLSEIILQQTRVDQGLPYYEKFIHRYPTVKDLASAPEDEIFRLWEGLGYYRRAQNMIKAARMVMEKFDGRFPGRYDDLLLLPGVGPYTAAAVASFASGEAVAVVDGNVSRVLARFTGYDKPINTGSGAKDIRLLAEWFLNRRQPDVHNQAVMELGALVCTPRNPQCGVCPFQGACRALSEGRVQELPVKKSAKPVQERAMDYLISFFEGKWSVHKRTENDIWKGLYEFPLLENLPADNDIAADGLKTCFHLQKRPSFAGKQTHLLTHRRLQLRFWLTNEFVPGYEYVETARLDELSFPIVLRRFLAGLKNSTNFDFHS